MRLMTKLAAAGWTVAALACSGSTAQPVSVAPTPFIGPAQVWVAVYDTAADPQELASERTQIVAALGDALEGAVVISPAGCFDGLPTTIRTGNYVLALQQAERVYVRALAEQLDGHPRFVGEVTVSCTD
jgi:hypothetical protein